MSREAAYQVVHDELLFDGNPRLNLASFVTTWMEPECEKLITESLNKNYIDFDEYPATVAIQVCNLYCYISYLCGVIDVCIRKMYDM